MMITALSLFLIAVHVQADGMEGDADRRVPVEGYCRVVNNHTCVPVDSVEMLNDPPRFPNIGYLGASYNILKGNPLSEGSLDPGFLLATNIFTFTYDQGLTTTDGQYSIPDYTNLNSIDSCSFAFSSTTTRDSRSYMESLKVKVDTSFGGWGASFSQSAEYTDVQESTKNNEQVFISSQAECQAYGGSIHNAQFLEPFITDVMNLPTTSSPLYTNFISRWGTHVAASLIMGGRYGYKSRFTSSSYATLASQGFNFQAAAGYSGAWGIDSSLTTEEQREQASTFQDARLNYKAFVVGGKPTVGDDGSAFLWAQTVKADPLPLIYGLTELYQFLDTWYFPFDQAIDIKRGLLREANVDFCKSTSPLPELCDAQFGPDPGPRIGMRLGSRMVFCDEYMQTLFCQHSENPNMRTLGAFASYSTPDNINSPVMMIDSRYAPSSLVTHGTGITVGSTGFHMRYRCPSGFLSVSDFEYNQPVFRPPALPCVSTQCLRNCQRGDEWNHDVYIISGGSPELGNGNDLSNGFMFFRDLTIEDGSSQADLFKCLSYSCLRIL